MVSCLFDELQCVHCFFFAISIEYTISSIEAMSYFDQCDDNVMNIIVAQFGDDLISRRNLRATCRRLRELIDVCDTELLIGEICQNMRNVARFEGVILPELCRMMNAKGVDSRRTMLREYTDIFAWSAMHASNSQIFRQILDVLFTADEIFRLKVKVPWEIFRWSDLDEVIALLERRGNYDHVNIHQSAMNIIQLYRDGIAMSIDNMLESIHSIKNRERSPSGSFGELVYTSIIRHIWSQSDVTVQVRENIIDTYLWAVLDLLSAQDMIQYLPATIDIDTVREEEREILSQIFLHLGADNISREIIEVLGAKVSKERWRSALRYMAPNCANQWLRAKVEQIFGKSWMDVMREAYGFSADNGVFVKWPYICEMSMCDEFMTRICGFYNDSFRGEICFRRVIDMISHLEYSPQVFDDFLTRARLTPRILRDGLRQIARAFPLRGNMFMFALITLKHIYRARDQSDRQLTMIDEALSKISANPILWRIYNKYGYIAI